MVRDWFAAHERITVESLIPQLFHHGGGKYTRTSADQCRGGAVYLSPVHGDGEHQMRC